MYSKNTMYRHWGHHCDIAFHDGEREKVERFVIFCQILKIGHTHLLNCRMTLKMSLANLGEYVPSTASGETATNVLTAAKIAATSS